VTAPDDLTAELDAAENIPPGALDAAAEAIKKKCQQLGSTARWHAQVALEAAMPVLAGAREAAEGAAVKTEWGSRDLAPGGAVFEMRYLGEEAARHVVEVRNRNGVPCALWRRTVTYGPWEEAPGE
jgi:hypothetical protein